MNEFKKPMEIMNITQVAKFFGMTTQTVNKHLKRGELPPPVLEMTDKSRRWYREQLEEFIKQRRRRRAEQDLQEIIDS